MSSILEAALRYREEGLTVIPLYKDDKSASRTKWQKEREQTEERVRELFEHHDGNIGILCGSASRIVVLDLDAKNGKDGFADVAAWQEKNGVALPTTRTIATPSGGVHRYFRLPAGRRVASQKIMGKGVDVQGEWKQVVAPPSFLTSTVGPASGRPQVPGPYRLTCDAPIADWPAEHLHLLPEQKVYDRNALNINWTPVVEGDPTYADRVALQREAFGRETLYLQGESPIGVMRFVLMLRRLGPGLLLGPEVTFKNYAECYDPRLPDGHRWLPDCEDEFLSNPFRRGFTSQPEKGHLPDQLWEEKCMLARGEAAWQAAHGAGAVPSGPSVSLPSTPSVSRVEVAQPAPLPSPHHTRSPGGLVFLSGGWTEPVPPPTYLVDRLILAGSRTLFVAHGGSLKSMCMLSMGAAIATGRPWLGQYATRKGPVYLVDWERSEYEARRRVRLLRVDVGLGDFHYCAKPGAWRADEEKFWDELLGLEPSFVGIDSLNACATGIDENDPRAALPLQLAKNFIERTGDKTAVAGIHHLRKGSGGDRREAMRGSTAIFAALDAAYEFEPIDAPDGIKRMRVTCRKMNIGPEPAPFAIEFSEAKGLVLYEEVAAVTGRNADTSEGVQAAIRLALAGGPIETRERLRQHVSKGKKVVADALDVLVAKQEVTFIAGSGYVLDGPEQRRQRVVRAVQSSDRWTSASKLAKASYVDTRFVDALLREGVICHRVGNGESYGFTVRQ